MSSTLTLGELFAHMETRLTMEKEQREKLRKEEEERREKERVEKIAAMFSVTEKITAQEVFTRATELASKTYYGNVLVRKISDGRIAIASALQSSQDWDRLWIFMHNDCIACFSIDDLDCMQIYRPRAKDNIEFVDSIGIPNSKFLEYIFLSLTGVEDELKITPPSVSYAALGNNFGNARYFRELVSIMVLQSILECRRFRVEMIMEAGSIDLPLPWSIVGFEITDLATSEEFTINCHPSLSHPKVTCGEWSTPYTQRANTLVLYQILDIGLKEKIIHDISMNLDTTVLTPYLVKITTDLGDDEFYTIDFKIRGFVHRIYFMITSEGFVAKLSSEFRRQFSNCMSYMEFQDLFSVGNTKEAMRKLPQALKEFSDTFSSLKDKVSFAVVKDIVRQGIPGYQKFRLVDVNRKGMSLERAESDWDHLRDLVGVTEPISIRSGNQEYLAGQISVVMNLHAWERDYGNVIHANPTYVHPHINVNRICYGSYAGTIQALLDSAEVKTIFSLTYEILNSFNIHDCYQNPFRYIGASDYGPVTTITDPLLLEELEVEDIPEVEASVLCYECGDILDGDSMFLCEECDEYYCDDHSNTCGDCGNIICTEHTERCNDCDAAFCSNHVYSCHECGGNWCEQHSKVCDQCGVTSCDAHSIQCRCGAFVCSNHKFACNKCNETVCQHCINEFGLCISCRQ
jgi:hypothetical protein